MRSARRNRWRISLAAALSLLLALGAAGCQTTQDTAAEKQAESKQILEAREQKQREHKERDDRSK